MALIAMLLAPAPGGLRGDFKLWLVYWLGFTPAWVAQSSLLTRRFHDPDHSGVWSIPIFAYSAIGQCLAFVWPSVNENWIGPLLALPVFAVLLWLIGAPGEKAENQYGAVPAK